MGNNLIHNYLNNHQVAQTPAQTPKGTKGYFQIPTVSSTMDSFDSGTDKLVKPLDGKGHLVNGDLVHMPKEFLRDTVYTTKALADGVRGKANDHQLGKMNDLGLKLGGLAIATYLMTQKATPKTKAMEFIGFGAFLASMKLWPKLALEVPARIIHGFNFRKKYVDDQGRKKEVGLDPNYMPFDLYKGDKKSEDLDVIGDRLGIRRDIPNRHEAIKDNMRKICVQNNTLWMLTAGIATPIMTALACNKAEKVITPIAEKMSNKKVNQNIDTIDEYLNGRMSVDQKQKYETEVLKIVGTEDKKLKPDTFSEMLEGMKGKNVSREEIVKLSDALAEGFNAEMKEAALSDISSIIGGPRYLANSSTAETLSSSIHSAISAKDSALAGKITPERVKQAVSEGIVRGAVKDMLTSVGVDILDRRSPINDGAVSTNFKTKEVDALEFFKVTPETEHMTPVERLAHNIKSIVMKVNNSNPSEDFIPGMSSLEQQDRGLKAIIDEKLVSGADDIAKRFYEGELAISGGRESYVRTAVSDLYKAEAGRGPKQKKLFGTITEIIADEAKARRGYAVDESVTDVLSKAGTEMRKFRTIDGILSESSHFKVEKANETVVANNWERVTDTLVKELGISDAELKVASSSRESTNELIVKKLEQVCSNEASYNKFMERLGTVMAELDDALDKPNNGGSGQMMSKLEAGFVRNCDESGKALGDLRMTALRDEIMGHHSSTADASVGSIKNLRVQRLHSRVDGVHSSYARLLQTCEFFHRSSLYEAELKAGGVSMADLKTKYGFTDNIETNKEIIKRGKKLLLEAHTDKFYNKMGTTNNPDFYKTLMYAIFRPGDTDRVDVKWNPTTEKTVELLDGIRLMGPDKTPEVDVPRRVFDGSSRRPLGQKLKEQMNLLYNSFGSINRKIVEEIPGGDALRAVGAGVSESEARACKRFDLLGKAPKDMLFDTLKQKYNSKKWMKTFAPVLAVTYGLTLLAQFFFGKKDPDIKA